MQRPNAPPTCSSASSKSTDASPARRNAVATCSPSPAFVSFALGEMPEQNAPKALSRGLLARMIAYRVQEERLGKLGREMRKLLDRSAKGGGEPVRHLKVGTVMVREHQGTLHEVMVVPGGFCWQEKTYPSLSQSAAIFTSLCQHGTDPLERAEDRRRSPPAPTQIGSANVHARRDRDEVALADETESPGQID